MSDIDFFGMTTEQLELMESVGSYPPRFHVPILCKSQTAKPHLAIIKFKGAVNDLEFIVAFIPASSATPGK